MYYYEKGKEYKAGYPFYGDSVGILMLDIQAGLIPGDVGNAYSYDFPVRFKILRDMPGNWWCDEKGPNDERCEIFINAARELEAEGCKAITSGCGFFAIYQERTANALRIPVFASPLLMVPMLSRMLGKHNKVGIITANSEKLAGGNFLKNAGIDGSIPYVIGGMQHSEEFYSVHVTCTKFTVNPEKMEREVVAVAKQLYRENPDIGLLLFECSNLPPFARAVTQATGLPVFDFISLAHMVHRAIAPVRYPEYQEPFAD